MSKTKQTRQLTQEERERLTKYIEILAEIALKEMLKKKAQGTYEKGK